MDSNKIEMIYSEIFQKEPNISLADFLKITSEKFNDQWTVFYDTVTNGVFRKKYYNAYTVLSVIGNDSDHSIWYLTGF